MFFPCCKSIEMIKCFDYCERCIVHFVPGTCEAPISDIKFQWSAKYVLRTSSYPEFKMTGCDPQQFESENVEVFKLFI